MDSYLDNLGNEDSAGFKNLKAILEYCRETRKMFRDAEIEINNLKNMVLQQNGVIELQKSQIQNLQISLYSKGSTKKE